jgi:hypothetical protein
MQTLTARTFRCLLRRSCESLMVLILLFVYNQFQFSRHLICRCTLEILISRYYSVGLQNCTRNWLSDSKTNTMNWKLGKNRCGGEQQPHFPD